MKLLESVIASAAASTAIAILAGWQRYNTYMTIQAAAQGSTNTQWLKQGDKNPHTAAHFGNYAFKPLGPLAFFDSGITSGRKPWLIASNPRLAHQRSRNGARAARAGDQVSHTPTKAKPFANLRPPKRPPPSPARTRRS